MRKPEQKLWDTFRNHHGKRLKLKRVENIVEEGFPDVYAKKSAVWIELKAPNVPKKETTRLLGDEGLRTSQVNWLLDNVGCATRAFVLIRDSSGRLFLIDGKHAATMNELSAAELAELSLADNWEKIGEVLS